MALGDQSKALRIVSKAKGWDPTQIMDGDNIANFDKAPNPWELGDQSVGKLPEGTPESFPEASHDTMEERVPFNVPDSGRERTDHRTSGADPTPGMPGA